MLLTIGVLVLLGCTIQSRNPPSVAKAAPAVVGVMVVRPHTVPISREYVARIRALYTVAVRSRVTGELTGYYFHPGQSVTKGMLLFRIDPAPYRIALASANASLSKAESDLAQSKARLEKAKKDVDRFRPLAKIHAIPQQDLADALAAEQERVAQLAQSKAGVQLQRSLVSQAKLNLSHTRIYSPISGTVGDLKVDPGNLVNAADNVPLTIVSSTDPMLVGFSVSDAEYLRYFAKGSGRHTGSSAAHAAQYELLLADGARYPGQGVFRHVGRALNEKTDTLKVVLGFRNPKGILRPGEYAQVRADLEERPKSILVPVVAVHALQGVESVLLVDKGNKVVERTVTTSARQGESYVVSSGLRPGDRVIVAGRQKVEPGDVVQPHFISPDQS